MGTTDAIRRITKDIQDNKKQGKQQVMVALDLQNAFNTAWEPEISRQLQRANVEGNLRRTVENFMKDRTLQTRDMTKEVRTERGCPQGSSLGPTLWIVKMQGWFEVMDQANENWRGGRMEQQKTDREGNKNKNELAKTYAYADDQAVVITGDTLKELETKWERVWAACEEWERRSGVRYNRRKTEVLYIPNKRPGQKIGRGPRIRIDGQITQTKTTLKYLGLTLDRNLSYTEHLKGMRKKITETARTIIGMARRTWGKNKDTIKTIIERVIKPAILYGSEIWGNTTTNVLNKRHIDAAMRPLLLKATKTYATVPTGALYILAGITPIHVEAAVRYTMHETDIDNIQNSKIMTKDKPHPATRYKEPEEAETERVLDIHVDASTDEEGRLGIGITYQTEEGRTQTISMRGPDTMDTNRGELTAIYRGIRTGEEERHITIWTDRKNAVNTIQKGKINNKETALIQRIIEERQDRGYTTRIQWERGHTRTNTMNREANTAARTGRHMEEIDDVLTKLQYTTRKERRNKRMNLVKERWQEDWDRDEKGRKLYEWCREVGTDIINLTQKATQLATGHGNNKAYLHRFGLTDTNGKCNCEMGEDEDTRHMMFRCNKRERVQARQHIETKYGNTDIVLRRLNKTNMTDIQKINEWAEAIVEETVTNN